VPYRVSYRDVKYPRLEFITGELLLILPHGYEPEILLRKHKRWILNKSRLLKECLEESLKIELVERTEDELKALVNIFAQEAGLRFKIQSSRFKIQSSKFKIQDSRFKMRFRRMRTKWASCSRKGTFTFNTLMKYLPEHLVRYVVFHEMAHLVEKRHNEKFWRLLSKVFSNFEEMERELLIYWFGIMKIM
jgi:predicted metal-dependent hydrolase